MPFHPQRLIATLGLLITALPVAAQERGQTLFDTRCVACHGTGGAGTPGFAPPLRDALPYIQKAAGLDYVLGVLTHGLSGKIVSKGQTFMGAMPTQADLPDNDIAALVNHLATLNGITSQPAKPEDVARVRRATVDHKALREQRTVLNP